MLCLLGAASQHRIVVQDHMAWAQHATAAAQGPRATHGEPERCRCSTSSRRGRFGSSPHHPAAICAGAVLCQKHQTRPQSKQTNWTDHFCVVLQLNSARKDSTTEVWDFVCFHHDQFAALLVERSEQNAIDNYLLHDLSEEPYKLGKGATSIDLRSRHLEDLIGTSWYGKSRLRRFS